MKLGIIITQTDPETVFNALRLALYSLQQGDEVRIFLSGKGVEIDRVDDPRFDVQGQARKVLEVGGRFHACGTCLKLRQADGGVNGDASQKRHAHLDRHAFASAQVSTTKAIVADHVKNGVPPDLVEAARRGEIANAGSGRRCT
jgi:uncharacterized protein involved in oxidation of intracellular sulfur